MCVCVVVDAVVTVDRMHCSNGPKLLLFLLNHFILRLSTASHRRIEILIEKLFFYCFCLLSLTCMLITLIPTTITPLRAYSLELYQNLLFIQLFLFCLSLFRETKKKNKSSSRQECVECTKKCSNIFWYKLMHI